MNIVRADLPRDIDVLEIHTLADLHLGDKYCDTKLIEEHIKEIADTGNAYVIVNGDILNNATRSSVSDIYSETLSPMQQVGRAVQLFRPIKNKILCINSGNHEGRSNRGDGLESLAFVASELGLSEKYSAEGTLLFIRFGKSIKKEHQNANKHRRLCYSVYATHGSGGGRKVGGKANRLSDLSGIIDTDIYLHSHTHLPMVFRESYFRVNANNSSVTEVDKLFVNTAAYLTYGGYGESHGYKPSSRETPVIYMSGIDNKKMWAKV